MTNDFEILNAQISDEIEGKSQIILVDNNNNIEESISIYDQEHGTFLEPLFKKAKKLSGDQIRDLKNMIKDGKIYADYDSFFEYFYNNNYQEEFYFEVSKKDFNIFFKSIKIATAENYDAAYEFCKNFANTEFCEIRHSLCDNFWVITKN